MCSAIEIAPGADPDDSTVDVLRLPGTEAEEQAAAGGAGSRNSVGSWISGFHRAGGHIPDAASTSLVLPRENNGQCNSSVSITYCYWAVVDTIRYDTVD